MRKLITIFLFSTLFAITMFAGNPKYEFRATWLATHYAIDWPKTKATSANHITIQKKELTDIFDKMAASNMNAVCLQARALSDAIYQSSYEPWSKMLTGTRGQYPGYDPLAFAVEEAHKRGLELHIWVNPFRVSTSTLDANDPLWKNAGEWLIKYNNEGSFNGYIIDPGYPESRAYVVKVLMEIINNYDVDGVVMDDYFYAYGGTTTEDIKAQELHYDSTVVVDMNGDAQKLDDWRRQNVDKVIQAMYDSIQAVKPWVRFGMGPGGIWTMQHAAARAYGIMLPGGVSGGDPYGSLYCNTVEWIKQGWVDYVNPQIYWSTKDTNRAYNLVCKWWAKDVCEHFSNKLPDGKRVHLFPSPAAYKAYPQSDTIPYSGYEDGVIEIQRELDVNRNNLSSGYTGAVFYNTTAFVKLHKQIAQSHFQYKALTPPMDWKVKDSLASPSNLTLSGTILTWSHPTETRFTVYAYPKGIGVKTATRNPIYLRNVVYDTSFDTKDLGDLTNITIAVYTYDRFGVEHGVALYNEDPNSVEEKEKEEPIEPQPTQDITWILNGGIVPIHEISSNEELWEKFKTDFDAFYADMYPNYKKGDNQPITAVVEFTWPKGFSFGVATEFMTQHPDWLWLAEYIQSIAGPITTANSWRYNLYAFFNATDKACKVNGNVISARTGDFTSAGLPSKWVPVYQNAMLKKVLPDSINADFTLSTDLIHPDGYSFVGWWDNANFIGEQLYYIPAYWQGTLYAKWLNSTTYLERVLDSTQPVGIYDLMGRKMTLDYVTRQNGIFIIRQGNKTIKIIK